MENGLDRLVYLTDTEQTSIHCFSCYTRVKGGQTEKKKHLGNFKNEKPQKKNRRINLWSPSKRRQWLFARLNFFTKGRFNTAAKKKKNPKRKKGTIFLC